MKRASMALLIVGLSAGSVLASSVRIVRVWSDEAGIPLDVQIVHFDGAAADATAGLDLVESDRIRTGWKSHATLDFQGKATVQVEELTEFKVAVFKLGDVSQVQLWMKAGQIQAQVRKESAAHTEFTVKTPSATASVRGTQIQSILYTPQTSTMITMGRTGSLLASGRHGPPSLVEARERVREDTEGRPLIDEAHLKVDDSRSTISPSGLTREEEDFTRLQPLLQTVSPNLGANGTSVGPLPLPHVVTTTSSGSATCPGTKVGVVTVGF